MNVSALYPGFGAKRGLAPAIVRQLGRPRAYWEPMCGSLAVLLALEPPAGAETVCDLYGDATNLARVLQDVRLAALLYRRLHRTLCGEGLFRASLAWWRRQGEAPPWPDAERAYHWFVVSWQGRRGVGGTAAGNHQWSTCWEPAGGNRAAHFAAAVDAIPAWHERLRRVTVLRQDGLAVVEHVADRAGTVVYVDPPYGGGRARRGRQYVHELSAADHARLAAALHRFRRARVVLSGYDTPGLRALYRGWTRLDVSPACGRRLQVRAGRAPQAAPEVLLVNGPAY